MKLILKNVKIYGYDPNVFRTFDDGGKQYSVGLYILEEDKALIDSYILDKKGLSFCGETKDGEIIFYGKSKQMIPVFDGEKNRITKPINEVFLADVSILVDEFIDKEGNAVRYTKCLGIKYISPVANEEARMFKKSFETFDDIFGEDEQTNLQQKDVFSAIIKPEEITQTASRVEDLPQPSFAPETQSTGDLPWDLPITDEDAF